MDPPSPPLLAPELLLDVELLLDPEPPLDAGPPLAPELLLEPELAPGPELPPELEMVFEPELAPEPELPPESEAVPESSPPKRPFEESDGEHELAVTPAVMATASKERRRAMSDVLSMEEDLARPSIGGSGSTGPDPSRKRDASEARAGSDTTSRSEEFVLAG